MAVTDPDLDDPLWPKALLYNKSPTTASLKVQCTFNKHQLGNLLKIDEAPPPRF